MILAFVFPPYLLNLSYRLANRKPLCRASYCCTIGPRKLARPGTSEPRTLLACPP